MIEWVSDCLGNLQDVPDLVLAASCVCLCMTLGFIYKLLGKVFNL